MANDDRQQTIDDFKESVNMTRKELEDWLQNDESRSVGQGRASPRATNPSAGSWVSSKRTSPTTPTKT
jgi:hypothetical protein